MTLAIIGSVAAFSGLVLLFDVDWRIPVGLFGLWLADVFFKAEQRARVRRD